jgi:hypothetical protein
MAPWVKIDKFNVALRCRVIPRKRTSGPGIYDGVDAPPTASMCQSGSVEHHLREASVSKVSIVGLDIAKHVFHGADERGRAIFSKRISRGKLLDFFAAQPSCTVALEACGGAHHWARQLAQLGHEVRLIPPAYVKPFANSHHLRRNLVCKNISHAI